MEEGDDDRGELRTVDGGADNNGDNPTNLTNNAASDYQPAFSPDGQKITFTSERDRVNAGEVYVMDSNGQNQINLTNNSTTIDSSPDWGVAESLQNTPPVANNDSYGVDDDGTLDIAAPGVPDNDADAEDDALTATVVDEPTSGDLTLNPDGSFAYAPNAGYSGTDSNTYKANDGQADSNVATVTITVSDTTPPPAVTGPPNNSYDTDGRVTLLGRAEPNSRVGVFEGSTSRGTTTTNSGGSWSKTLSGVSDGTHTYKARATDAANNTSRFSNTRTVRVDTTKPSVKTTSPAAGARNVPANANVTATFSETMSPSTVNANTMTLVKKGTTRKVAAGVSYSASDKRAVLNPNANLTTGATYTATVTTGVRDAAGNAPARNKTWTFTVRR